MSRPLVGPRLRRVLALVPWIADHPGVTIEEIATRFEVPVRELQRDLELLPMCGLPPYTADRLIDVEIADDQVWIRFAEYFARPLHFTAAEGLALLTAGRALLAVPGSDESGSLARALDKLAAAVGAAEGLAVEVGDVAHLDALRAAVDSHERVEIDYYSFGRDARTTREIDPDAVFHAFGQWYVHAYCHLAADERLFRADRVLAVRPTGQHFTPRIDETDLDVVYHPRADDPRVTLELGPAAHWIAESFPVESFTEKGDTITVVLPVSERAWLERIVLQAWPDAVVTSPPDMVDVASEAARRVLGRYESRPAS